MESRLLRINSRFKQPNETNTQFSFIYDGANISSVQLLKFACTRLFPNIFSPYDTLIIDGQLFTIRSIHSRTTSSVCNKPQPSM